MSGEKNVDLPEETDLEWLAELDWQAHGPARNDHPSRHLFLAEAAELIGQSICGIWPGIPHFLTMAGLPAVGQISHPDDAFSSGTPIPEVHLREHGAMRRHAERLGVPISSERCITLEEWEAILVAGDPDWDVGQAARQAAVGIAQVFARMVVKQEADVFYRPVGGGKPVPVDDIDLWEIDNDLAIKRLAVCGLSLERPFDPDAPIDHFIFVSHNRLAQAIGLASRRTYVPLSSPEHHLQRDSDYLAVQVSEVSKFLNELMVPENYDWNNDRFKRAVMAEFGSRGMGRVFEDAKAAAVALNNNSYFGKPGRKKRPEHRADLGQNDGQPLDDQHNGTLSPS